MSSWLVAFEFVGVEHRPFDLAVFSVGWSIGWLLLWRPHHLPSATSGTACRAPVVVIVPARDEAHALPIVLRALVEQRRPADRIVVVDDHSSDGTGDVARSFGVKVVTPPALPDGWLGKPHACWHAARSAGEDVLVFIDADVRPGPTLLDDLAAQVTREPHRLVSVQPWHRMETAGEQPSTLCNVTALMACGAFTALGRGVASTVAFGPVIAVSRSAYHACGGHAAPTVRNRHTEDIALARAVGASELFVGSRSSTTLRMYPGGPRELVVGWTRSLATGARYTRWWLALGTALWITSLAGGWIATPIVYPLSALQVWILGRRAGSVHPVGALVYPLLVVAFVVIAARSLVAMLFGRRVTWKGRSIEARPG